MKIYRSRNPVNVIVITAPDADDKYIPLPRFRITNSVNNAWRHAPTILKTSLPVKGQKDNAMVNQEIDLSQEQELFWQKIYNVYRKSPSLYIVLVFFAALAGFVYILLSPVMLAYCMYNLLSVIPIASTNDGLALIIVWGILSVAAAVVTGNLITLKIPPVKGMQLDYPVAMKLHDLLKDINEKYDTVKIDNIVVAEQATIDVIKTPSAPFPLFTSNTLVLGLPLLQCLSPEYFQCAVTRKMMLYSKRTHFFTKWLQQLRQCWTQYLNAFVDNNRFSNLPHIVFFSVYAPFYRKLATPISYREELRADTESLEIIDDEDLLQTMESILVTKIFLDRQYWPKIQATVEQFGETEIYPYTELESILKTELNARTTKRWLDAIYRYDANRIRPIPDLKTRMDNIGRSKIRIPEKVNETAGRYFLGRDYHRVVAELNKIWVQQFQDVKFSMDDIDPAPLSIQLPIDGIKLGLPSTIHVDIFN